MKEIPQHRPTAEQGLSGCKYLIGMFPRSELEKRIRPKNPSYIGSPTLSDMYYRARAIFAGGDTMTRELYENLGQKSDPQESYCDEDDTSFSLKLRKMVGYIIR
jgi:hypothetical protein